MLLDDQGRFNFSKYQEMNEILGLPAISRESTLRETLGLQSGEQLTFAKFKKILEGKS